MIIIQLGSYILPAIEENQHNRNCREGRIVQSNN